jgi:hypothetical protein
MKTAALLYRLASLRRTAGAGPIEAVAWAVGLLWRSRTRAWTAPPFPFSQLFKGSDHV